MVSAIVLAAGMARRFGSPKPLAQWEGKALLRHVVDAIDVAEISDVIVVTPPDEQYAAVLRGTRARRVVNAAPEDGQGSSLRHGVDALQAGTRAVLVVLGDQPTIARETAAAVLHAWTTTGAAIVAPSYRGVRGHPVLFAATLFEELRAVAGDMGAREVIQRHQDGVHVVAIDMPPPPDVDTPEDLVRLSGRTPIRG